MTNSTQHEPPSIKKPWRNPWIRRAVALFNALWITCFTTVVAAQDIKAKDLKNIGKLLDLNKIGVAFFVLLVFAVLARLTTAALDGLGERFAARRLLLKRVAAIGRFLIYMAAALIIIFAVIRPEKDTLLALSATLAVTLGLALKDIASSIIAGVIVLIDAPFQVGDRVQYGDTYGEVVEIGLRTVKINTLDDNLVSIPNNKFLTDVVASSNAGALDMMVVIDFHIGLDEDFDLARQLVFEATATSRFVFLNKPVSVLVAEVPLDACLATRIRTKFYVSDTRYETQIKSDITMRVKRSFRAHNILSPYSFQRGQLNVRTLINEPTPLSQRPPQDSDDSIHSETLDDILREDQKQQRRSLESYQHDTSAISDVVERVAGVLGNENKSNGDDTEAFLDDPLGASGSMAKLQRPELQQKPLMFSEVQLVPKPEEPTNEKEASDPTETSPNNPDQPT